MYDTNNFWFRLMIYNVSITLLRAFSEFKIHENYRNRAGGMLQILPNWQELLMVMFSSI